MPIHHTLGGLTSVKEKEEVEIRKALDLELEIAIELKRREEAENAQKPAEIKPNHLAFISAYPFYQFVRDTFPILEQGREFRDNWHIDIGCETCQALVTRQTRNVIINIPRRTMKSILYCVQFPAWVWTFLPHLRFLYTSYSANFAKRDNEKTSNLIQSAYYQQRFGEEFYLTTDRRDKLANSKGGFRAVFKIGKGTGEGGDFVFADDPNAIDQVESDTVLKATNNGWNEVSYHNVTDRETACRAIIQQRTAPDDLTGNITEDLELKKLYNVLCLAMKYESDNPLANTPKNPFNLGVVTAFEAAENPRLTIGQPKLWVDPRDLGAEKFDNEWYQFWYEEKFIKKGLRSKGENQLLWENYITESIIKTEVSHLKAYGESSQFQQRPIRRGGNFFNSKDFLDEQGKPINLSTLDLDNMVFCRYWDKAGTDGAGDWTVGMLVGRTWTRPFRLYIIDIIRVQVGYYERMQLIKDTAEADYKDYVENRINSELSIGIEKEPNASGKDLSTIEMDELLGYDAFTERPRGTKGYRAKVAKSMSEAGRLKIVRASWNAGFIQRLEKFDPNKENQKDDEIDTLSGATRKLIFGNKNRRGSSSGRN